MIEMRESVERNMEWAQREENGRRGKDRSVLEDERMK
jgi:hypothetical protein